MRATRKPFTPLALAFALVTLGACPSSDIVAGDAVGSQRKVVFTAETSLAFEQRLAVGSKFPVSFRAFDDETSTDGAQLVSVIPEVLTVDGPVVTITGPGTADLRLEDAQGGAIDTIAIKAGFAGATTLVDGGLFLATQVVDPRLPASFGMLTDIDNLLQVSAVDKCGGDLLDLHASTLTATGVEALIEDAGATAFTVHAAAPGDIALVLSTPGLEDLTYDVEALDSGDIDEVSAEAAAVDGSTVTLWGRAFANDKEVIGDNSFTWQADERVTLAAASGSVVTADVLFPANGDPPDERPATVTAEIFGEEGTLDLLTAQLVTTRGTPARELPAVEEPTGCEGQEACNPEAAAIVCTLGMARLRGRIRGRLRTLRGAQR